MKFRLISGIVSSLAFIFLWSCTKDKINSSYWGHYSENIEFLDSTIDSSLKSRLIYADSLFFQHRLLDARSAFMELLPGTTGILNHFIQFRKNEVEQKLNTYLIWTDSIYAHTDIRLNTESGNIDSLLYYLDEINLYNTISLPEFENLANRVLAQPGLPLYWSGKINLVLAEYYFFESNDLYKAYEKCHKAIDLFTGLSVPTHELIYAKKDAIQYTIGQREYLLGRQHGQDMIQLANTHFKSDTILNCLSQLNSAYIDRLALSDKSYIDKYHLALHIVDRNRYPKLYQQGLISFLYVCRLKQDTTLIDSLTNQLNLAIAQTDTFVNVYKSMGEAIYFNGNTAQSIPLINKAIQYQLRFKRFAPPVYLTLSYMLIYAYRQIEDYNRSNQEVYNNLNYKYPFKSYTSKDLINGHADYGYFNFVLIGEFIQNQFLEFQKTNSIHHLQLADSLIWKANELVDKENYSIEENRRVVMLDYSKFIYNIAIQVYFELYQLTKKPSYLKSFYFFQEKTKANILSGEWVILKEKFKIPAALTQRELRLKEELRSYRMNYSQVTKVNQLYKDFDSLNLHLKTHFPEYYEARVSNGIKPLSEIQLPDSILFVSQNIIDGQLYSFFISDSTWMNKMELTNQDLTLLDSILSLQGRLETDENHYRSFSQKLLSRFLPEQIIQSKKVLIYCPSNKLNGLHLASLYSSAFNGYLGDHIQVFNTFSASTMNTKLVNPATQDKTVAFSFSDQKSIKNPSMIIPELPGAYQDVLKIGSRHAQSKVYAGQYASKKNCLKAYQDPTVSHLYLAVHGVSHSNTRENIYLLFRTNNPRQFDTLYGYELLKYTSAIPEITLAACETANGTAIENEGVYSLVRYLKLNGAKKINASYWKYADNNKKRLISYL